MMTDTPDEYARAVSMAVRAILHHLFLHLEEKGMVTFAECDQILSDAIADHVHPQETDFEIRAVAILQEMKDSLGGSNK
jgi:hypothetical protein